MKKIILLLVSALFIVGCYDDENDYSYTTREEITVEGIEPFYTRISGLESVKITPTVQSSTGDDNFSYLWGVYETEAIGFIPQLDTLALTKDLDWTVNLKAKTWNLVFKVTNNKNGYTVEKSAKLNVTTLYLRGWYVLKDDGKNSDLDAFFTSNTSVVPNDEKVENILEKNSSKLKGEAINMYFLSDFRIIIPGTQQLIAQRSLVVASRNDIAAYKIEDMSLTKREDDLFYMAPDKLEITSAFLSSSAHSIIYNKKYANNPVIFSNDGRYGNFKMRNSNADDYELSPHFWSWRSSNGLIYDLLSSSFVRTISYQSSLTSFTLSNGPDMLNTSMIPEYIGAQASNMAYAIMKSKTSSEKEIWQIKNPGSGTVSVIKTPIKSSMNISRATCYACNLIDETILYFVADSRLYSFNLSTNIETIQCNIPTDEKVTMLRHHRYKATNEESDFAHSLIVIGTVKGDNYQVKMYKKNLGNLDDTPFITLHGKGIPKDIIYMSPWLTNSNNYFTSTYYVICIYIST